jgi:hypothetical protein
MLVLSLCNYEAGGKSEAEFTCPDKRGAESTPYIAFVLHCICVAAIEGSAAYHCNRGASQQRSILEVIIAVARAESSYTQHFRRMTVGTQ